jgi:hypothetical protein
MVPHWRLCRAGQGSVPVFVVSGCFVVYSNGHGIIEQRLLRLPQLVVAVSTIVKILGLFWPEHNGLREVLHCTETHMSNNHPDCALQTPASINCKFLQYINYQQGQVVMMTSSVLFSLLFFLLYSLD